MNSGRRRNGLETDIHVEATQRLTEALIASENRMRRRIEMLSEAVFETDSEGRLVYLNAAWGTILGRPPDACIGRPLAEFIEPDHRQALTALMLSPPPHPNAARTRPQVAARRPDGTIVWLELSVAPIDTGGVVGVFYDVTFQRQAQDELTKLSLVASSTDNMVIITDAGGRIEWVNRSFAERTGYSLAECQGRKPGALLQGPMTDSGAVERIRHALARHEAVREELVNYTRAGDPYWVSLQISPVPGPDGRIAHYISVQADSTQRKRFEQEILEQKTILEERVQARTSELARAKEMAEAAAAAKTAFLANMSHEIRTPLNAIVGLTYLCLQTELSAKQRDYVAKTERAAQNLIRIVSDILDFSKIDAGAMVLEEAPFLLADVLGNVDAMFRDMSRMKGLGFAIRTEASVPRMLVGDALRLEQVLVNLVGNAIKFTRRGLVSVDVSPVEFDDPSRVHLEFQVRDTGIGLTPDQLPRIFRAFSQGDSSTTRHYGGTGLGLAISDRLVAAMGGAFQVDSTPGVGSVFRFTARFGRVDAAPSRDPGPNAFEASPSPRAVHAQLRGARILVAEDNDFNQQVLRELLERAGATVTLASTGREAIGQLSEPTPFDLVLMDIQMPDLDGLEAARKVRSMPRREHLPVIAMTANVTPEDRARCLAAGMNDFEAKPIDPARLYATLERWLPQKDTQPLDLSLLLDASAAGDLPREQSVHRFLGTLREALTEMNAASAWRDMATLRRLANGMKSAAAQVGAIELIRQCDEIERAGDGRSQRQAWADADAAVSRLPEIVERISLQLARHEQEQGSLSP